MEDLRFTNLNGSKICLQNDEDIGPQIDIFKPQIVEVKYDRHTLWINVDGVCRLRVSKMTGIIFDTPGFTQREVEG